MAGGNISVLGPIAFLDLAPAPWPKQYASIRLFVQPLANAPGCTIWPVYVAYDVNDLTTVY